MRNDWRYHALVMLGAAGASIGGVAVGTLAALLLLGGDAFGHVNVNTGISYPASCCSSAATSTYGDCAPISSRYVTAGPDGYHIDIPVGAHPKLKTKGYKGIVPYGQERAPLDHEYHICLSTDGQTRYCFFPMPFGS